MSEPREIGIALLGLGNVGSGVIKLLEENAAAITARLGARLVVRGVYGETIEGNRVDVDFIPSLGPAELAVPDLGTMAALLDVTDPTGDDTGPGTYTYPTDAVFQPGNFDITNFQVGADDENILFRFTMAGPVDNPCLLYTSPSPRDGLLSRMPSSA